VLASVTVTVLKLLKGKGREICIAPHRKKLTSEALRHGSHSFYTANTPCLPFTCKRSPEGATTDSNSSHLIGDWLTLFVCACRVIGDWCEELVVGWSDVVHRPYSAVQRYSRSHKLRGAAAHFWRRRRHAWSVSWKREEKQTRNVTKQYNLVPAKWQWCSLSRKLTVGLVSHWPCVTDSVV